MTARERFPWFWGNFFSLVSWRFNNYVNNNYHEGTCMVDGALAEDLVSVIIPMHNAEQYIAATLASALAQTHRTIEVIVVDDGSTDGSAAVVERVAATDARVRLIRQPNRGVAHARNRAIAASQGQFIAPLDADDLWHSEKIERQVAAIQQSPRIGGVCTWCFSIDAENRVLGKPEDRVSWTGYVLPALVLENFSGCASSPLMRRDCVLDAGGYDTSLHARNAQGCEDYKLLLAIAQQHDLVVLPLALTGYRQTPDSMSRKYWSMLRSYELVISETMQRCPDIPAKVFRWSRSNNHAYLAGKARQAGAKLDAMYLYLLAIRSDWVFGFELLLRTTLKVSRKIVRLDRSEAAPLADPDLIGLNMSSEPHHNPSRLEERVRHRRHKRRRRYVGKLLVEMRSRVIPPA
jgi:glycosyltransferase involved in cell wall biosynthesis